MAEFNENDFDDLMFPVYALSETDNAFNKFPSLKKYKEFTAECPLPFNKTLKYIAFMYDAKSPLYAMINNISRRKMEAAYLAGFEYKDTDTFEPSVVENLFKCTNPIINGMILRYCRIQKNIDWSDLVVFEECREKQKEKLFTANADDDKTKDIIQNILLLKKTISDLITTILNGDKNKELVNFMYEEIEEEQLMIKPELIAQAINEGRNMVGYFEEGSK